MNLFSATARLFSVQPYPNTGNASRQPAPGPRRRAALRLLATAACALGGSLGFTAATATTASAAPQLALAVTANPNPARPGETVDYAFTVSNVTTTAIGGNGLVVQWTVPSYVSNDSPGTVRSERIDGLAPGQAYTFHQTYRVAEGSASDGTPPPPNGSRLSLSATADLFSGGTGGGATAATESLVESAPVLTLGIDDDTSGSAAPKQKITYTITAANRNSNTASGVAITAPVPAGATFVSANNGGKLSGTTLSWSVGTMAPGAVVSRSFVVTAGSAVGIILAKASAADSSGATSHKAVSTVSTVVRVKPDLALSVTANHSPARPGETVDFTFTVSNPTAATIGGSGLYVEWAVPNFVSDDTPGTVRAVRIDTLSPGQSYTFHEAYTVSVGSVNDGVPPPPGGSILRLEASTYLYIDGQYGANAVAEAVVGNTPTFVLGLTDDAGGAAAPGQKVTYTLTATNRGSATLASTLLSAPVPAGTTLVSSTNSGTFSGTNITWSGGSLAPGAAVRRSFTVTAGSAPGIIQAQGVVSDSANASVHWAETSLATTVSTKGRPLEFTVTADHNPVKPGESVDFTFTVSNPTATAIGGDGVLVEWTVPNFVSSAAPGAAQSSRLNGLAPGQSYTFHQHYLVAAGSVNDGVPPPPSGAVLRLEGSASIYIDGQYGAAAVAETVVESHPTFTLGVTDDASGSVAPGQKVTYTLTATNRGSATMNSTLFNATVPVGTTLVSASNGGSVSNGVVSWSAGTLPAGAAASRSFVVTAGSGPGLILTHATVDDSANGTSHAAAATAFTTVRAKPALELTVTADHSPVRPGESVDYTFTVSNPTAAAIAGSGLLVEWMTPNFVSSDAPGTYNTSRIDGLAPGQSVAFHQHYIVAAASPSDGIPAPSNGSVLRLDASAYVYIDGSYGASAAAETIVEGSPTLTLGLSDDTTGSVAAGQKVVYTLTATNRGSATVSNLTLNSPLPAGTTFVSANDGGKLAGGVISWTLGSLPAGAVVSRSYVLTAGGAPGLILAQGTVLDAANSVNRAASALATTVRGSARLGLAVTANPSPARPGEVVDYAFTVSNLSATAIGGSGVLVEWMTPNFVSSEAPGTYHTNRIDGLAPGQSVTFHQPYVVSVGSASDGIPAPPRGSVLRLAASASLYIDGSYGAAAVADAVVESGPTLTLGLTDNTTGNAARGSHVTYTLTATNRGGSTVGNAQLSAAVPTGTTLAGASNSGKASGTNVVWSVGAMAPGAVVTRTFVLNLGSLAGGILVPVQAKAFDANNAVNAATAETATTVRLSNLLGLSVKANHAATPAGGTVVYTFTVANPTTTSISGSGVLVEWVVPNYVTNDTPGALRSQRISSVAAGKTFSFLVSYTVDAGSASEGRPASARGSVLRLEASASLYIDGSYGAAAAAATTVEPANSGDPAAAAEDAPQPADASATSLDAEPAAVENK